MRAFFETILSYLGLLLLLVTAALWGQTNTKKVLTVADYGQWSSLRVQQLSDRGQWVSYTQHYDLKPDTLFVKSTDDATVYAFARGMQGKFNGDAWFGCMRGDTLQMKDLKSGRVDYTPHVHDYTFAGKGKYLLVDFATSEGLHRLEVQSMWGAVVVRYENVLEWKVDETGNVLAYSTVDHNHASVHLLYLGRSFRHVTVVEAPEGTYKHLTFKGRFLAFMKPDVPSDQVYRYDATSGQLLVFDQAHWQGFPADKKIADAAGSLSISDDGARVFFYLKEMALDGIPDAGVQVWHAWDRQLYSNIKLRGVLSEYDKLAVWWPDLGKFYPIGDEHFPVATLSGDGRYAFVWDPLAYEPQWDFESPRDVYIVDLLTNKRQLFLKQHTGHIQSLLPSRDGKFVAYPSGGHWWVYDIARGTYKNLTAQLGVSFFDVDFDRSGEVPPYGNPGWSGDGSSVLFYDQYDIWQVAADGRWSKRLTKGRELGITYRLQPTHTAQEVVFGDQETIVGRYDLHRPLLLTAQDLVHARSGYSVWQPGATTRMLVWQDARISRFIQAKNSAVFIFISERFDCSPELMMFEPAVGREKLILATNTQQQKYHWGKAERISYQVQGKTISGALFWPADYQVGRRYPLIVHIYERQLGYLHEYVNPTLYNEGGFNITNLTTQGYFVLLPDIEYRFGEVGASAVQCVLAAVDAVIAKGCIDAHKMALEGHSFGGYETDYIITQTNRFATAISGAAFTDVVSSYLYIGGHYAKPDYWRFEHFQQRLGKSLYEDPQLYLRNSPVMLADQVQTPLLAWTGEQDRHVNYYQSIEFYLALRRLQKKHTLLIYPGEGHALMEAQNQIDFTRKMEQWLGYYLKGEQAPSWME